MQAKPSHVTRWSPADLADAIASGLQRIAMEKDLEQAVYGLDAGDELDLHPGVARALEHAGYGVWREQRYPGDSAKSKKSEGKRCDLVLTPSPDLPLRDPDIKNTLFDTMPACDPQEAYWLEIKTVAQFEPEGPAKQYSKELLSPVADDVRKLWSDPLISHAGLLLVLYTADKDTAEHDLMIWHRRCLDKGLPVSPPASRGFALADRIGNGHCSVSVFAVRG